MNIFDLQPLPKTEVAVLSGPPSRQMILQLEEAIKQLPPAEAPTTHHFASGVYGREMLIPAGVMLTGKIHKTACLNVISKGDITVATEFGNKRIKAPYTFVSPPGVKRAGYAHEDTIWICFHGTEETDLDKIEEQFTVETFEEFDLLENQKKLENQKMKELT